MCVSLSLSLVEWNRMDVDVFFVCCFVVFLVVSVSLLWNFGMGMDGFVCLLALPTTKALKDIVFRFIIEYSSSLRDFGL